MSHIPCVCAEGRGETEATGANEAGPSTPSQKPAAAARPGAMETSHSDQTSQHTGEPPVLSFQRSAIAT